MNPDGEKIRLDHPRWRLILIQGIIDHVTGVVLHHHFTAESIAVFQSNAASPVTGEGGFGVGFSTGGGVALLKNP